MLPFGETIEDAESRRDSAKKLRVTRTHFVRTKCGSRAGAVEVGRVRPKIRAHMIEVKGITKYYGDFKALDDVSFNVGRGEVLGFLGPNGAGKSTTMKVLTTFISASEGTASVCGHDVHAAPQEVRKRIGYLPETPPLYGDMTVEDYLTFAGNARGLKGHNLKDRLETVVTDCGLRSKLKSRIIELSKGYKQRTGLAQALIHDPDVLILDEPTSGLDPMQIVEIRKLIERLRENRCIIFSTHILQEATAVADRLVIVNLTWPTTRLFGGGLAVLFEFANGLAARGHVPIISRSAHRRRRSDPADRTGSGSRSARPGSAPPSLPRRPPGTAAQTTSR